MRTKVSALGKQIFLCGLLIPSIFYSRKGFSESPQRPELSKLQLAGNSKTESTAQSLKVAVNTMGTAFDASLTSMETVDFILMPALQTQEALSGDSTNHNGIRNQAIRFDAEILQESIVLGYPRMLLFARYWVSADSYRISVLWAEPHGRTFNYPIYPTGLNVSSDSQVFNILDYMDPRKNTNYAKPIPPRGVFRHMYGTYPVEEIGFAENEAAATKIAPSDLASMVKNTNYYDGFITGRAEKANGQPLHLEIEASDGKADVVRFLDNSGNVIETEKLTYILINGSNQLNSKIIYKTEQPITVGFHGPGIKISRGQITNQFRELPMIREKGGRTFLVEFQLTSLNLTGNSELSPISIEVRNSKSGTLLHSAKMDNFQRVSADDGFSSIASQQKPPELMQSLQDHQRLVNKVWDVGIEKLSTGDLKRLQELREFFEKIPDDCSSGERLRKYATLISLNRLLSDESRLKNSYVAYLNALQSLNLPDFIFAGGYDVIKGAILWGHPSEANELIGLWFKAIGQIEDKKYIERFASDCMNNKDFWMAAQLLEKDSQKSSQTFETAGLNYLALIGTSNILANAGSYTNRNAKNEFLWVSNSAKTNRLNDLIKETKNEALQKYNQIAKPTDTEKGLFQRISGPPEKALNHRSH